MVLSTRTADVDENLVNSDESDDVHDNVLHTPGGT